MNAARTSTTAGTNVGDLVKHILIVGPEPLRRHVSARQRGELVIDCSEESAATAVRGAGLFGGQIRVVRAETLTDETAKDLAGAILTSPFSVTVEADKLTAKPERHLTTVCELHKPTLSGAAGRSTVRLIAGALALELAEDAERTLLERVGHDPGRLVSILEALAAGGYRSPTRAHIEVMAGSSSQIGLPWTLLDQIERRDPRMVETLERLEAIPTLAFLAKRFQLAAMSAEEPAPTLADVSIVFGETSEGAWRQAVKLGRRLGPRRCGSLLETLARADVMAKRGHGPAALTLAVGHIAQALNDR